MGVSIVMGVPQQLDGLFHGKSENKVDDNWGYPYFRKPPYPPNQPELKLEI